MTTRHIAAEDARLHDLTPEGSSGRASKRFRRKLAADGFTVDDGFRLKPGYLYTVVRAISARVNQNYDGWPSDELKKSYKTFIGKPVFVNHENHDPTKARGVVVAARYVENGPDRYIEVVQEVDAERFPKLAHEIKTGGLDSVSMGAEAGFTICSYCHNKATDLDDMCDHVRNHKGKTLTRFDKRTGKKEDVLVFESCHKISFFELSYVFEPADETAVASKVVVAGLNKKANGQSECGHNDEELLGDGDTIHCNDCGAINIGTAEGRVWTKDWNPDDTVDPFDPRIIGASRRTAEDVTIPAPPGTPTVDQSVIDSTPVYELTPATELTGHEAPGLGKESGKYTKDDFDHPSGKMPWERDKESDAEDAAAIEIEAMLLIAADDEEYEYRACGARNTPGPKMRGGGGARVYDSSDCQRKVKVPKGDALTRCWQHDKKRRAGVSTAGASDDYWVWKAEHGEEADKEREYSPRALPNPALRRWVEEVSRRMERHAMPFNPNTQHTQLGTSTLGTYFKAHDYLDSKKAPRGRTLDFGAGRGYSGLPPKDGGLGYHTFEPHPAKFVVPKGPTYTDCCAIPDASYKRVVSLNVLNVLDPHDEPGGRSHAVQEIGRVLAPGGHAILTTRPDVSRGVSPEKLIGDEPGAVWMGPEGKQRRQKGFTRGELHEYVSGVLGDGYTVSPIPNNIGGAGVMVVRNHDRFTASLERNDDVKKIARQRALKLAFGEVEAPMAVDTLREEGSAPEDDDDDFERYVEPPKDLQTPDLSEAQQVDRQQEEAGAPTDTTGGVPGAAEGGPAQGPQQQYMTLQIPMPSEAPQVPQQAAPPQMVQPPQDPAQQPPMQMAASTLDYFDRYYGRRVANWLDAIEARREMTPAEAADYRRQAEKLSTLENGREHSTTNRNPGKEPADMARNTIASRSKVARAGRRQHLAEGPFVDGGPYGRNDEGEQEEAFISQVPPAEPGDFVTDEGHIHNTEHNLVARVQQGRDQLLRDARQLAALRQRRAFDEAGGPTAEVVDPTVHTGPEGEALTGDNFISADPNDGVVPTNPKDASLRAFQAFDSWLAEKTGKSSRRHTEANIKKAAAQFSREAGISPQALFPALGIVLREARKNTKKANTKGAAMRKRADEKLEVAAPDGRVDVEAPVENVTSAEAQASQFDIHDFGNNAGDDVAKPDLSTDQNWAPGEASGQKAAAIKTAGGLLAMRCAEGMIAAGLEPNSRERKYQLAAEFENMNRGLIQDRVALLERFAAVREADRRKVASGSSRGAARSPIPAGLGGGTRTAAAGPRVAAHDPSNDSTLFI